MKNHLLDKAKQFAVKAHKDQTYGENAFIYHPMQVACILAELTDDQNLIAAGYLHDVLENCPTISYEDLREAFNDDIASLVREVTKREYNTFPNLKTQRGVILKFADRLCNLSNMKGWDSERKQKYIEKSKFWVS